MHQPGGEVAVGQDMGGTDDLAQLGESGSGEGHGGKYSVVSFQCSVGGQREAGFDLTTEHCLLKTDGAHGFTVILFQFSLWRLA